MAKTERTVTVSILADLNDFRKKMRKASFRLKKFKREVGRSAKNIAQGLSSLTKRVAGFAAVAVGSVTALVKSAAAAGDELDKMSQRTGVAVETLSGMGQVAALAGTLRADWADSLYKCEP